MEFELIKEQIVHLNSKFEKQQVIDFLEKQNLSLDKGVEYTVALVDGDKMIGTGSFEGRILKCIAVDAQYQNRGLSNKIITHLVNEQYCRGNTHLFLYTKPENEFMFSQLGFYEISRVPSKVILMENKLGGLKQYLTEISYHKQRGENVASIVVNCNPFTLGHLYLVEYAASRSDHVHLFVVWEDQSVFPAEVRYKLVKEGVKHLSNVTVHKGKDYIISNATFPSYFIKEYQDVVETHAALDLRIFGQHIAPVMGINKRYAGEEPYCAVTRTYNQKMKEILPQYGIEVVQVPRMTVESNAISASRVRKYLREGEFEKIKVLVPKTTYSFLCSQEALEIIERIRASSQRH
ncbi:[citrate (pro-3S)-lyase] ligase [Petroclostridium sp. X23]|uniref:[citrate (pro-3S)-lyase] ligase n=1 Tax=Petroclostridium sp. X23 TaxID=3045146 RepID=UPI0024AE54F9|nr:[citrate (pro-3S)-lyase] ligase [Petroclostridium sp. X23]WHH60856.1 [citrate (pro-3S)-lyase] ligase [Petroclostridium sp. X23]